ncbi:unnamed protein product [Rhizoctonia solani]|uniref:Uncharacterized protein n=1 Tax=Rhizoctonia solani TaxID=456999 RepID=A0A8H3E9E3_9AGAM|nr:unnamed protein product [Rhizoctonia solani]
MRSFNCMRAIRENWFFCCLATLLVADIAGIVYFTRKLNKYRPEAMLYRSNDSNHYDALRDFRMAAIAISRCSVSLVNGVYLTTYGFVYTNTIIGTFLFQQCIYYPLITLYTALGCWFGRPFHPNYGVAIDWSWLTIPLGIRGICDLLITMVLWCFLVRNKDFRDRKPNCITVNVEELASGTRPIPRQTITWRGIKRQRGMRSARARLPKMISNLAYNALFRQVIPVETRRQVLFQHIFSLAAMALLIARTVIELQKASDNLPSRTLVEPCQGTPGFNPENDRTLYVRLPHLRGVVQSTKLDMSPYVLNVSGIYQCNMGFTGKFFCWCLITFFLLGMSFSGKAHWVPPVSCSQDSVRTEPDSRVIDWFLTYQCPRTVMYRGGLSHRQSECQLAGYQYSIQFPPAPGNGSSERTESVLDDRLPHMWVVDSNPGKELLTPYFTPPMEPEPGWHMVFDTSISQRKFIVSSPIWDAITGSDPTYEIIVFFPGSQHTRAQNQSSNSTTTATGFIHSPEFLDASKETPRDLLKPGIRGPSNLCDTVEEYRISSSFDLLASIGGLLALLQGIHVFIFGRPLFWGMFGAKMISPFGLAGQFATQGFKERLQEHYYSPHSPETQPMLGQDSNQTELRIDMTQFLLDYVIDMGPASSRVQPKSINSESDSEDEEKYAPVRDTETVGVEATRDGEGFAIRSREHVVPTA